MTLPDPELCPREIRESLTRYVEHGIPTGDFLASVLANDLRGAIARADVVNASLLPAIVSYVIHALPYDCQGSWARVEAWLAQHTERRAR